MEEIVNDGLGLLLLHLVTSLCSVAFCPDVDLKVKIHPTYLRTNLKNIFFLLHCFAYAMVPPPRGDPSLI